jgi:hypothetical protein
MPAWKDKPNQDQITAMVKFIRQFGKGKSQRANHPFMSLMARFQIKEENMFRKIVASIALFVFLGLSGPHISQAQPANSFIGKWRLTFQLPGVPFPFNYEIVAEGAPANEAIGVDATTRHGVGTVTGLLDLCPNCRIIGLTWRHTPLTGAMPTGVTLSFEAPSPSSPSSFNLRGAFATPDRIEGMVFQISDDPTSTNPNFDPKLGYVVNTATFVMTRQP